MRRKSTRKINSPVKLTDGAMLQKISILSHLLDKSNVVATVSYNLSRLQVYIHFAPDSPLPFKDLQVISIVMDKLNMKNPTILFRENLITCAL